MTNRVLAVGASGKFAGLVIPALAKRGVAVRGMVREIGDADKVRRLGAAEVVAADLNDRASVDAALEGVSKVFYIAPAFADHEAALGVGIVEAARHAGVERFVFSSVIHPTLLGLSNHAAKGPVEEAILNSGMQYTLLHPTLFFQNYAAAWPSIVKEGVVAEPWSNETRFSRVDYRDVAEVAAIALTEDRLRDGTFELCSEGWLDRHDVASLLSRVLGRTIEARRIDPSTLGADMRAMQPMFEHYDRVGLRGNALTLRAVLGREPTSLESYFRGLSAGGDEN